MSNEDSDGNGNELKVHQIPRLSENVKKFKELLNRRTRAFNPKGRQRKRLLKKHRRDRNHRLGRRGSIKHPKHHNIASLAVYGHADNHCNI